MALLAARDWRTRLAGEFDQPLKVIPMLHQKASHVDLVLLDTDIPGGKDWIPEMLNAFTGIEQPPVILCIGIRANPDVLSHMKNDCFVGYILKNEINFSLAWAIDIALTGKWVVTEGVRSLASDMRFTLPPVCGAGRSEDTPEHPVQTPGGGFAASIPVQHGTARAGR
jgi:hypothetical protein